MTYDTIERSADLGRPIELYAFSRGAQIMRYTSADKDRVVEFNTYKRAPIQRGEIEQGAEINRSGLKLVVPRDFEIAQLYIARAPSETVALILRVYHEGDGEIATIWNGRVLNVRFFGSQAEIVLEPIGTSVRRNGLGRPWQRPCPHALYGSGCKVNPSAFRLQAAVDSISGTTVSAGELASVADGYWDGGYVEWPIGAGVFERRDIIGHTGASVTLDSVPVSLPLGTIASFFPGCDGTPETCNSRFSNILNFGGMPYFPQKNPFGSDPVY